MQQEVCMFVSATTMNDIADLPLRQKIFLTVTILIGLLILIAYVFRIISMEAINVAIFFYGLGVPFLILAQDLLVDLNDKRVFKVWAIVGVCFFLIYLLSRNNPEFRIRHSPGNEDKGMNKLVANGSTNVLKSLPVFLVFYSIMNNILKRSTGNCIVNTFKQSRWYNDIAHRNIFWYDVFINLALFIMIICAAILRT
jgi:hypothetical protein